MPSNTTITLPEPAMADTVTTAAYFSDYASSTSIRSVMTAAAQIGRVAPALTAEEKLLRLMLGHGSPLMEVRTVAESLLNSPVPTSPLALKLEKLTRLAAGKRHSSQHPMIPAFLAALNKMNVACEACADPYWADDVPSRCLAAAKRLTRAIEFIQTLRPHSIRHPFTKKVLLIQRQSAIGAVVNVAAFRSALRDLRKAAHHTPYFEANDPRYQVRSAYLELIRSYLRHGPDRETWRNTSLLMCFSSPERPAHTIFKAVPADEVESLKAALKESWSAEAA